MQQRADNGIVSGLVYISPVQNLFLCPFLQPRLLFLVLVYAISEYTREMGLTLNPDQSLSEFQVTDQDIEHLEGLSLSATAEPGHDGDDEKAVIRSKTGKLTPEPSPGYDEMKIVSMGRRPTPPNDTSSELDGLLEFVESTLNKADINKTRTLKTKLGDSRLVDEAEDWPASRQTARSALGWDHRKFTLRVYPTGLAPRTRKMDIIWEQPWEVRHDDVPEAMGFYQGEVEEPADDDE